MSWWVWLLIVWGAISTVCAVWWGLALANADRQDRLRQQRKRAVSDQQAA